MARAHGITPEAFNGFDPAAFMPETAHDLSIKSLQEMASFNRQSAKTHSGIWRDLAVRKRRTEADDQLGPIVTFGHKVGVPTPLTASVLRQRTVGAFVNFGADYHEPGVILFGGRGAVVLGELDGTTTPRLQELHGVFLDFDANAMVTANIWGYLWGKLAYGAQLFATALTHESIADAFAAPNYQDLYIALAQEVMRVARAHGITPEAFNGFDPAAFMPETAHDLSIKSLQEMASFNRQSAKTHSGIWRDLAVRKRRTEADDQLGPIVTFGHKVGVPTPLTARLIALIHEIEDGQRPQQVANLEALQQSAS